MDNVMIWLHIVIGALIIMMWITAYIGFNQNDKTIARQRRKIKRLKKLIEDKNNVIDSILEAEQQNEEEGYVTVKKEDVTNAIAERCALIDYQTEHIESLQRLVNSISKTFNFNNIEPYEREEPEFIDGDEITVEEEEKA